MPPRDRRSNRCAGHAIGIEVVGHLAAKQMRKAW